MTLKEMDEIAARAAVIRLAQQRLAEAQEKLNLLHRYRKRGINDKASWEVETSWEPKLLLKVGDRSGYGEVSVKVRIPYGVVEQQLVDDVNRCRREVIKLGGNPP